MNTLKKKYKNNKAFIKKDTKIKYNTNKSPLK